MSKLKDIVHEFYTNWRILDIEWSKAKDQWKDVTRDYVEEEYWKELEEKMQLFLKTMSNLQESVDQAVMNTEHDTNDDFY